MIWVTHASMHCSRYSWLPSNHLTSSGFDSEGAATSNRIVVAVEDREGKVIVEVSDNGRELSETEAEHAFDPFFRTPVRGAGVGVGLGVARSVAVTLGGGVALA